jgi:hypothetical protein
MTKPLSPEVKAERFARTLKGRGKYWGRTYASWAGMRARCNYASHTMYKYYGGRGINVCGRWATFAAFMEDMGERPEGMTLDRIDADKDYELSNCRWASPKDQRQNQRRTKFYTYNGKTMCLLDWIREITGCEDKAAYKLMQNSFWKR